MEKINLLKFYQSRHRKKKIVAICLTIVFLILGALFTSFKLFYESKELDENMGFFQSLSHLVLSSDRDIAAGKETVNILFLGIGGAGHDGPYLTDTMLVVSINKKENKVAMISIPRDLLVNTYKFGKQKINALNAYAEAENAGNGTRFARDVISELLRVPIHFYARVDFSAFEQLVDAVGGIDIDVPRAFSDPLYPRVSNPAQTTTVTFEAGPQHMDGRTALIYARSRHGNNNEGSDFARSRRQQQIILALKNKILTGETLLSLGKIKDIYQILKDHVDTDVSAWEAIQLVNSYKNLDLSADKIAMNVLTAGPDAPLYATYYNNQYILLPKKPDLSDLRAIAANPFSAETKKYIGAYKNASDVSVMILNGTEIAGLAAVEAGALTDLGYKVKDTGNAPSRNFEKTVIYNITPAEKKEALEDLIGVFNAHVAQSIPDWMKQIIKIDDQPDFVIVVGAPKDSSS